MGDPRGPVVRSVAQVCHRYHPYIGGVETVVKQLSERLVRLGIRVDVLTHDPMGLATQLETINGVTVRRFKTTSIGVDSPFSGLFGFLRARGGEYDLVHAHGYHALPALYAATAKGRNKLVVTAHYHGRGRSLLWTMVHALYRPLGRRIFDRADAVIPVSEFEKSLIRRHFRVPEEKTTIIPNGVDHARIAVATPFEVDTRCLLFVGRLERYKQVHIAIQALACLSNDYSLVIVGDGPDRTRLGRIARMLGLSDRVRIASGLKDDDVYRWYKTCCLVLNLSDQEAFGLTVLEGRAAGKPVLVNDKGALRELAMKLPGVHAIPVSGLSPSAIAHHINTICARTPQPCDVSSYGWDAVVRKTLDVYEGTF